MAVRNRLFGVLCAFMALMVCNDHCVQSADIDGYLYVAASSDILKIELLGGIPQHTYLNLTGYSNWAIDIDPVEGEMYWSDTSQRRICKCSLDCEHVEVIVTNTNIQGLALDVVDRKVYWTNNGEDTIERSDLDGSNREVIVSNVGSPFAIDVDGDEGRVYWINQFPASVERSNIDGTDRQVIISGSNLTSVPYGLTVDSQDGVLYLCDDGTQRLDRHDLDAGTVTTLLSYSDGYLLNDMTVVGDYIYWTENSINRIGRADKYTGDSREYIGTYPIGGLYGIQFYGENYDPCETGRYREIDDKYRSRRFNSSNFFNMVDYICDNDLNGGWYRFTSDAGGEMPTSCVEVGMCGTQYPVWIDDHSDNYENITKVTGCINKGSEGCCDETIDMRVKDCGNFKLYHLKPLPNCPAAYCAGDVEPCPYGEHSLNGFQPGCTDDFPKLSGAPTLSAEMGYMTCRFTAPYWQNSTFTVEWIMGGGDVIDTIHLDYKERVSRLSESYYRIGKKVGCRVSSKYKNSYVSSPPEESNDIFIGIDVTPSKVNVLEDGPPVAISIQPTVPMNCQFKLVAPKNYLGRSEVVMDRCTVDVEKTTATQDNDVKLYALRDCQDDGGQVTRIKVIPTSSCSLPYEPSYMETVQIRTNDKRCGRCRGTTDPHYYTVDGVYFSYFGISDVLLVRSKSRKFEVHARTWQCFDVSCHCGVTIRENKDIITVDMCYGTYGKTAPQVMKLSKGNLARGVHITRDKTGKRFEVTMPSGSSVRAYVHSWGMSLYLQVSSDEYNNTEGFCGIFNDDSTDEFTMPDGTNYNPTLHGRLPDKFTENWLIPVSDSLFNKLPEDVDDVTDDEQQCSCFENDDGCGYGNEAKPSLNAYYIDITAIVNTGFLTPVSSSFRRKRRSTDNDDVSWYSYTPDPDFVPANLSWPTPSGITEQEARDLCKLAVSNSSAVDVCKYVSGINIFTGVDSCVEDIKVTDSVEFLQSAVTDMQDTCEEQVLKNVALYETDEDGTATLPIFYQGLTCPGDCSFQGVCIDGLCDCNEGFGGADCSIDSSKPPEVWFINGEEQGLCDIREDNCTSISIIGDNFLDSDSLTCHYVDGMITSNETMTESDYTLTSASLKSFREILCELDVAMVIPGNPDDVDGTTFKSVTIFVSNDGGVSLSDGFSLVTYDSKCRTCDRDGHCELKRSSCEINGHCFDDKEFHPTDETRQCQPELNEFDWTSIVGYGGVSMKFILIGVGTAVVLVLLVVAITVGVCASKKSNKIGTTTTPVTKFK